MYGEQIGWFARFMQRFQPTPIEIVKAELLDAKILVLQSQSQAEFAALRVKIHALTAQYHSDRIERLQAFVDEVSEPVAFANVIDKTQLVGE